MTSVIDIKIGVWLSVLPLPVCCFVPFCGGRVANRILVRIVREITPHLCKCMINSFNSLSAQSAAAVFFTDIVSSRVCALLEAKATAEALQAAKADLVEEENAGPSKRAKRR